MTSRIHQITNIAPSLISFSKRNLRPDPAAPQSEAPANGASLVSAALDAGITLFHAAHERETLTLAKSLKAAKHDTPYLLSTTDGDALSRCPGNRDSAADAVHKAVARKLEMFEVETLDLFSLYDFRRDVHQGEALHGAANALGDARNAGRIRVIGATCYGDYDALADAILNKQLPLDFVIVRYHALDRQAGVRLIPLCRDLGIDVIAAQTFSWRGDIPFTRFPNIWRYRNMTKNFHGMSVAQAHLKWLLNGGQFDSVLVSMQEKAQLSENVAALKISKLPLGIESLFQSIGEAITDTSDGWIGLLEDDVWEYRLAAQAEMERRRAR